MESLASLEPEIGRLMDQISQIHEGDVADYIPELGTANPDHFGVSFLTTKMESLDFGNSDVWFTAQSISKVICYLVAQEVCGEELTHASIGHEPSGHSFNEITLDSNRRPHNPMINAGGLMSVALILNEAGSNSIKVILDFWSRIAATDDLGIDGKVYESERRNGHRNYALAHFMKEHCNIQGQWGAVEIAELYFLTCSVLQNTKILAKVASTLANGGIQPETGEVVFSSKSVRNSLALMLSSGMYDYSGQFAFEIGMPAKSGVSGCMIVVLPDSLGLAIYSPRVDRYGNSVRGVRLCEGLVRSQNLHILDNFKSGSTAG